MIRILQNWDEVGDAVNYLHKNGLPLHATPQKNWDHYLLAGLLSRTEKGVSILDMGCGPGSTLLFLSTLGFRKLIGVDLTIWPSARMNQLRAFRRFKNKRIPWRMRRGDICRTGLPAESIDVITCISVIEHCVPPEAFANECARLLKPNGLIFLTTDYWEETDRMGLNIPSQHSWILQDKTAIKRLIDIFSAHQLVLHEKCSFPTCSRRVVNYEGAEYTFIALAFRKLGTLT